MENRPRRIKGMIRAKQLGVRNALPPVPDTLTVAKQKVMARAMEVCDRYYRLDETGEDIGTAMGGLTHQRVSQLLKYATPYLIRCGWLHPAKPEKKAARLDGSRPQAIA